MGPLGDRHGSGHGRRRQRQRLGLIRRGALGRPPRPRHRRAAADAPSTRCSYSSRASRESVRTPACPPQDIHTLTRVGSLPVDSAVPRPHRRAPSRRAASSPHERLPVSPIAVEVLDTLSDRERQVLSYLAQGYTYISIARRLNLSPHTVDTYLRRIRGKTGASNRAHLMILALEVSRRAGLDLLQR
ncbi:response regulator transcription factor [Streptomyces sp. enrichment culture]|uniref:helix-turn-helix transcriptional regulator n=1 Tax=Streptomyces sp. enrichment culture TaxID=1795815 RepID=UPI003F55122D